MITPIYQPQQAYSPAMSLPGRYYEWGPCEELRRYIYCYWFTPSDAQPEKGAGVNDELVVPDGCMDLVFRLDGASSGIESLLIGTMERTVSVNMEYNRVATFGIRFYPGGLQPFLRESARLFTNRMVDLTEVAPIMASGLKGLLEASCLPLPATISRIDQFLISRLSHPRLHRDDTFHNALAAVYESRGLVPVKELACREAVSEKQLTRIFKERTGLAAKTFCTIIRFQHTLQLLHNEPNGRLTETALQAGYYDQAHFIREFHSLTDMLPSGYTSLLS
jgi:AraC-like DNA-binding protein